MVRCGPAPARQGGRNAAPRLQPGLEPVDLSQSSEPLVSVVTPVLDGERWLAECIESVLAQTWSHWEYVIVDNCSADGTGRIAARYAAQEPRIRVLRNDRLLPIIANWNHALRQMHPDSAYCKVLHADDCLFPECIERMVALAEAHPSVGVVGSYRLRGRLPRPSPGLPHTRRVFPGEEICRATLRRELSPFGSPSSVLVRARLVRERERFYDERFLHADKAVCLELLEKCDFGFLPEILSFSRVHDDSVSAGSAEPYGTRILEDLLMLRQLGARHLEGPELAERLQRAERRYYRNLARRLIESRDPEVLRFHRRRLREFDATLRTPKLARAALVELASRARGRTSRR